MSRVQGLAPASLRRVCDTDQFAFKTTAELPFTKRIFGQPRGTRSIEFGVEIDSPGFNIYVLGLAGTGRATTIERFLQEKAADSPVPGDWVYVQNFQDLRRPRAIRLPPGKGSRFRDDMAALVESLKRGTPEAFSTEEYQEAHTSIAQELEAGRSRILQEVRQKASEQDLAIVGTPGGLVITPVADGQPMDLETFRSLPAERRAELDAARGALQRELEDALRAISGLEQDAREKIADLRRSVAASVADRLIEPLKERYDGHEESLLHLDLVRTEFVEHVDDFRPEEEDDEPASPPGAKGDPFRRYLVNLIVDHSRSTAAPVVVESNPTLRNLVGRMEYEVQFGVPTTDFTNIKAGSLHQANGGYLVVRAGDLLGNPHAWRAFKRALSDGVIRIEEPATDSVATKTLDPEPIPLDVKIVLMGSSALYYSLFGLDEDFPKLFKVKADFDADMERSPENENEFALFVAARCHEEGLRHFEKGAVGKIVEYGSRLAGSQKRLATRFGQVANVVREASYWAGDAGRETVATEDVTRAIKEHAFRSNLIEERLRRQIDDGTLFIDTSGEVVGQVNGLYVVDIGDYSFGQPSRITAQSYMGRAGVVSIEREVKLAGPIHDRGVLTLVGYLGGAYAQDQPLSLSASLAFEQNYTGVDGDSASSAELYALLSSLSGFPINQGVAVTGSVNQWGHLQPIGGVTEKTEGFFEACLSRGLTGEQGVIVPAANVEDLMLREEVVAAVAAGQFHVWAVETIDEGLELLTGVPAGERGEDGTFPDPQSTVHGAVQARLHQLAIELEAFGKDEPDSKAGETDS